MEKLIIAAGQAPSIKGEIEANIATHLKFTRAAIENGADMIVFPELSLTGYEPEIARDALVDPGDPRLSSLKILAEQHRIVIAAGAPVDSGREKPHIGALIIGPDNTRVYIKNHLHPGEEDYFSPREEKSFIIRRKGENIAMAICADINHSSHAENAAKAGASIYVAGVLMMGGYDEAVQQMRQYSKKHSMAALMANYASPTGGYIPAGRSGVWDNSGNLLACADPSGDALVLLIKEPAGWSGKVIPV